MGKPMMLKNSDDQLIIKLRGQLHAKTKIEVVRQALKLLENHVTRQAKIEQWKRAVKLSAKSSYAVLQDFQTHSPFKK